MENTHVSSLEAKHAGIEQQIVDESRRPRPDMATLLRLKRQKLRIKEEIFDFAGAS
jgi:uncharacterized protein